MAYVIPTVVDLKARYPEFATVADGVAQGALDEGAMGVDETWPEVAFTPAWMLYAAHRLTLDGHNSLFPVYAGDAPAGVKREKAGDHEREYFSAREMSGIAVGSASWFGLTRYGSEFARLQRQYFGGPRVY